MQSLAPLARCATVLAFTIATSPVFAAPSPVAPALQPGYATLPPGYTPPPAPSPSQTGEPSPAPSTPLTPDPLKTLAPQPFPSSSSGPREPREIRLDRTKLGIVTGTNATVNVSGGTGLLNVRSSFDGASAAFDAHAHRLTISGRGMGSGSVTLFDSFGDEASLEVRVGPGAGVVPSDVTVELAGVVSSAFATARIQSALNAAAQLQPGATLQIHNFNVPETLKAGDLFEAAPRIAIVANDPFIDVSGSTNVHVKVDSLESLVPLLVDYSDDPEKLGPDDDGVLYRSTLSAATPARLYLYHVSTTPGRKLYLALQSSGADARVQMLGYAAGPSGAYGYAGHVSTLNYLLERSTQESAVYSIQEDAPAIIPLGVRAFAPLDLIDAIFDLRVLEGDGVNVEVISASNGTDPLDLLAQPERPGDGHGRRGEFSLEGLAPLALTLAAGATDPPAFSAGVRGLANLRQGGRPLIGDYGVLRQVQLQMSNPTTAQATLYFYELPQGGAATTTLWFDGDPKPTEIPCVKFPNRYTVRAFDLAPGATLNVNGSYMTDGASSFPLIFGLTSTPPSPLPGPYSPDACFIRPSPTPPPAESGTPPSPAPPEASPSAAPLVTPSSGPT